MSPFVRSPFQKSGICSCIVVLECSFKSWLTYKLCEAWHVCHTNPFYLQFSAFPKQSEICMQCINPLPPATKTPEIKGFHCQHSAGFLAFIKQITMTICVKDCSVVYSILVVLTTLQYAWVRALLRAKDFCSIKQWVAGGETHSAWRLLWLLGGMLSQWWMCNQDNKTMALENVLEL